MADEPSLASKARTLAFRDSVVLALNEHGVEEAKRPALAQDLSAVERQASDRGEISGLPWLLHVHRQQTMDFSGTLDRVRERAHSRGFDLYAVIHHRKGHSVHDAYVVVPLSVFARVLSDRPSHVA